VGPDGPHGAAQDTAQLADLLLRKVSARIPSLQDIRSEAARSVVLKIVQRNVHAAARQRNSQLLEPKLVRMVHQPLPRVVDQQVMTATGTENASEIDATIDEADLRANARRHSARRGQDPSQ
jgi:hypothetical protein